MENFVRALSASVLVFTLLSVPAADSISIIHADTPETPSNDLQNQIDAYGQQIAQLNQEILQYQAELQKVGADKATLQDAINALNLQLHEVQLRVTLTQHQINATQLQIVQSETAIASTGQSITANQMAIGQEIRGLQQHDNQSLIVSLLSSGSLVQAWNDVDASVQAEKALQNKVHTLQVQENDLAQAQATLQQKNDALVLQRQDLALQQQSLAETQQSKNVLLAQTNAQESKYEKLLQTARAELASFSTFAKNAGGSGLLTNQTVCDAWGCYYNQRDRAWGNAPLDGTQYVLASDGCLVTSMAMVMTHYGYRDVTPATIDANPNNFAAYYPAYLLMTIYVDGVTATRKAASIDSTLSIGHPVVVGLHAYGGTHFVVLVSGRGGKYLMRDPYIENGKDINFSTHYSVREIYEISRVVIQ